MRHTPDLSCGTKIEADKGPKVVKNGCISDINQKECLMTGMDEGNQPKSVKYKCVRSSLRKRKTSPHPREILKNRRISDE